MVFFRSFEGIFEIARQRAVGNAEVRTNLFEKIPNDCALCAPKLNARANKEVQVDDLIK
jgi:hypothetical protein